MRHSAEAWSGKTSEVPFYQLNSLISPYFTATSKGALRQGLIREKGPVQQSAIQPLSTLYAQHLKVDASAP